MQHLQYFLGTYSGLFAGLTSFDTSPIVITAFSETELYNHSMLRRQ